MMGSLLSHRPSLGTFIFQSGRFGQHALKFYPPTTITNLQNQNQTNQRHENHIQTRLRGASSRQAKLIAAALVGVVALTATIARAAEPLTSWNDGPAKQAIVEFVKATTTQGSPQFVPPEERIATFD